MGEIEAEEGELRVVPLDREPVTEIELHGTGWVFRVPLPGERLHCPHPTATQFAVRAQL